MGNMMGLVIETGKIVYAVAVVIILFIIITIGIEVAERTVQYRKEHEKEAKK